MGVMSHFLRIGWVWDWGLNARVKGMANCTKVQVSLWFSRRMPISGLPQYHQTSAQCTWNWDLLWGWCRTSFHCTWSGCLRKSPLPLVILDMRRSWHFHLAAEQFSGADPQNFWPQGITVTKSNLTHYFKLFCPGRGPSHIQDPVGLMTIPEEREPLGPLVSLWHKHNSCLCVVCPQNILSISTRHLCPHILFLYSQSAFLQRWVFCFLQLIGQWWLPTVCTQPSSGDRVQEAGKEGHQLVASPMFLCEDP